MYIFVLENINGYPKDIDLEAIFRIFLWKIDKLFFLFWEIWPRSLGIYSNWLNFLTIFYISNKSKVKILLI